MQKVIRRTLLAEKQAARRLAKRKDTSKREQAKSNREQSRYLRKDEVRDIKTARLVRKEDWELGPLAPRRDVGSLKEAYGTINSQRTRGTLLNEKEKERLLESVGGKYLVFSKEDRVVLLEGRDKGKIGKITAIDAARGECTVEGLNLVDVAVPKWMLAGEDQDKRPVRTVEQPVPLNTIRLVYPLTDPETGETKDVIVKKLETGGIFHRKTDGKPVWSRYIPGLNIKVPWPKQEPKEYPDHPSDTLRLDVENKTFIPTLLRPPMPGSVIDELRNKYSIFRTRHDPEYIEKKMEEDMEKERQQNLWKEMRTPLMAANKKEKMRKKRLGKKQNLTPEMLEKIGQVIARKKQIALDAAGMSAEPSLSEVKGPEVVVA